MGIATSEHFWDWLIRETVEIQLDENIINGDICLHLSKTWRPAVDLLKNEIFGKLVECSLNIKHIAVCLAKEGCLFKSTVNSQNYFNLCLALTFLYCELFV